MIKCDFHREEGANYILHWNFKKKRVSSLQITFKTDRNSVTKQRKGRIQVKNSHTIQKKSDFQVSHSVIANTSRKVKPTFYDLPGADVNPRNPELQTSEAIKGAMKNVNAIPLECFLRFSRGCNVYHTVFLIINELLRTMRMPAFSVTLASAFSASPPLPADWLLI